MQRIRELQQRLKEVQKIKPSQGTKLNERNVVDIVQKLIQMGKVKLIHTQDGKEYLTRAQLEKEILQLVSKNQGRMSLLDLTSYMGVGIEVVEPTVMDLCNQGHGQLINQNLLTQQYIDLFIEDLKQLVTDMGKVAYSDLTGKHWLPIEFIRDTIQKSKNQGKL